LISSLLDNHKARQVVLTIKMPATKPIERLRKEAAAVITEQVDKIGISKAASELKVSRQALYDIKNGKYCPSLALIQRACATWDLRFRFRGLQVDKTTLLGTRQAVKVSPNAQGNFAFEALESLEAHRLEGVKTKRVGKAIELVFRFTMPA
jgi:DNA-binding XRE family transcriptional regulator